MRLQPEEERSTSAAAATGAERTCDIEQVIHGCILPRYTQRPMDATPLPIIIQAGLRSDLMIDAAMDDQTIDVAL